MGIAAVILIQSTWRGKQARAKCVQLLAAKKKEMDADLKAKVLGQQSKILEAQYETAERWVEVYGKCI